MDESTNEKLDEIRAAVTDLEMNLSAYLDDILKVLKQIKNKLN